MTLITTLDNRGGMQFNHRRLSRDCTVTADILKLCKGKRLHIFPCSADLFTETGGTDLCTADFQDLSAAGPEDVFFLEDRDPAPFAEAADTMILYGWNRDYPADLDFFPDLSCWTMTEILDFPGYSHPDITKTVFQKTAGGNTAGGNGENDV